MQAMKNVTQHSANFGRSKASLDFLLQWKVTNKVCQISCGEVKVGVALRLHINEFIVIHTNHMIVVIIFW